MKRLTTIRKWIDNGGGFIGVGITNRLSISGKFFQLSDVLGVDKEVGFTLSHDKYNTVDPNHFIVEDIEGEIDFGEGMASILWKMVKTIKLFVNIKSLLN